MNQNTLLGILIPFAGTALGSAMVFFMKKEMDRRLEKLLLGFASGVMMAASVWSLLIPAIDMAGQEGGAAWFPPAVGFLRASLQWLSSQEQIPSPSSQPLFFSLRICSGIRSLY